METKTIHINKEKQKEYIIPTNEWLNPIKELYTQDINTRSLLMLSKMADRGEVVVKISKNSFFKKIKLINNLVKFYPNMLHTFVTLEYDDAEINYDTKYKKCPGYCNKDKNETENIKVTLEVMKKYDSSLNIYLHKLNLKNIKSILTQLFFCQLHAFNACGFLHMDIHLSNILIKNENKKLKYTINKKNYYYETSSRIILMDFDQSQIINRDIIELPKYNPNYTLIYNIIKTVNHISKLLPLKEGTKLNENIEKAQEGFTFDIINISEKILRAYYKNSRDYNDYIEKNITQCISVINEFWKLTYDVYLFPDYTLDGY